MICSPNWVFRPKSFFVPKWVIGQNILLDSKMGTGPNMVIGPKKLSSQTLLLDPNLVIDSHLV